MAEQPLKIPFVAATVLTANTMKPELAAEVLKKAGQIAQSHIEAGDWRNVKLVLRFLACLQGLFEGEGIFPLLEELFSRAVDLQTGSSEDVGSFFFFYLLRLFGFVVSILMTLIGAFVLISLFIVPGLGTCEDHPFHNPVYYVVVCFWLRGACFGPP